MSVPCSSLLALPSGHFRCIVADPPWRTTTGPQWNHKDNGHKPLAYPVMSMDEIKALPVGDVADDAAHLFLWTTNILVRKAYEAVFGVFAAPVQECLHRTANDAVQAGEWGRVLTCYAAWNVQRSADGGKPTFEHRRFCCVGALSDAALRWVRR